MNARPAPERLLPPQLLPARHIDLRGPAIAASWAIAPVVVIVIGILTVLP